MMARLVASMPTLACRCGFNAAADIMAGRSPVFVREVRPQSPMDRRSQLGNARHRLMQEPLVSPTIPVGIPSDARSVLGTPHGIAPGPTRIAAVALLALLIALLAGSRAHADPPRTPRLIVGLAAEGPHAVQECGAELQRSGDHRTGTADRSDSLDRLHARFRVRGLRPLFRADEGAGLAGRRDGLARRITAAAERKRSASAGEGSAGAAPVTATAAGAPSARARGDAARLAHVYLMELEPGTSTDAALAAYAADPHVRWVALEGEMALDASGRDPFLDSVGSWGQPYPDLWGHRAIEVEAAWAYSRGEGVVVAVVDTGLDWAHPDIAANVFVHPGEDLDGDGVADAEEWNGVDDDGNGYVDDLIGFDFANSIDANGDGDYLDEGDTSDPDPFDDHGHGTHVAGIIAAAADDGFGMAGVAPRARIMALKGFRADGGNSDAVLWRAVLYAALNGADVVNNSWSCGEPCPRNPLAEEIVDIVHALGVVIVTSAGNRSRDVAAFSPENSPKTIAVGSTGAYGAPSLDFTNQGWGVDVMAPGGGPPVEPGVRVARRNVLSLLSSGADPLELTFAVGPHHLRWAGTSMSAPYVAGVVALLKAQRPHLGPDALRRLIRGAARDMDPPGFDWATGAGELDARAAVASPPLPDLVLALEAPRAATLIGPRDAHLDVVGTIAGEDLAHWRVTLGRGPAPSDWDEVARGDAATLEDEIASLETADLQPGGWVLRVEAFARDGRRFVEHVPFSVDRVRAQILSPEGPQANAPSIAGQQVVWESRRGETEDAFGLLDADVFIGDFEGRTTRLLAGGPGNQSSPSIARAHRGHTVAWHARSLDLATRRAEGCRLGRDGHCAPVEIAPGVDVPQAPVAVGPHIAWIDASAQDPTLRLCRFGSDPMRCIPKALALPDARYSFLETDGRSTLSWLAFRGGLRIEHCRLSLRSDCAPRSLAPYYFPSIWPAASGELVAWRDIGTNASGSLLACSHAPETGDCDPVTVLATSTDDRPRVSGDVIVFEGHVGNEASDVFYCEFDPLRRRCPVQRLTAELLRQDDADVDGRRVVWTDEREGGQRIAGTTLPALFAFAPRRARIGRPLEVIAFAQTKDDAIQSVHAERVDPTGGASDDGLHVSRVTRIAGDWYLFRARWCPAPGDAGRSILTLAMVGENGLVARRSVEVEVEVESVPAERPERGGRRDHATSSCGPERAHAPRALLR